MTSRLIGEQSVLIPAVPSRLEEVHDALDRFWKLYTDQPSMDHRLRFTTAVAEVSANIIRHAYRGNPSPGTMELRLRAFPDRIEALFSDGGRPFTPSGAEAAAGLPEVDLEDLPEAGLGLGLVRLSVDQLHYTRTRGGINRWRLVQQLRRRRR